jgi:hypothetical protein
MFMTAQKKLINLMVKTTNLKFDNLMAKRGGLPDRRTVTMELDPASGSQDLRFFWREKKKVGGSKKQLARPMHAATCVGARAFIRRRKRNPPPTPTRRYLSSRLVLALPTLSSQSSGSATSPLPAGVHKYVASPPREPRT